MMWVDTCAKLLSLRTEFKQPIFAHDFFNLIHFECDRFFLPQRVSEVKIYFFFHVLVLNEESQRKRASYARRKAFSVECHTFCTSSHLRATAG